MLAANEAWFREINDRIEANALEHGSDSHLYEFICECSNIDCAERIRMTLSDYQQLRAHPTRFAIVPGHEKLAVAELFHHLDLVMRHRPERVVDVVGPAILGTDAVAIAAQIGGDDMEMLGEAVGDLAPRGVGQRVAVQQQ